MHLPKTQLQNAIKCCIMHKHTQNAIIRYYSSDMILMTDTDAAYRVLLEARSRISVLYYFEKRMLDYSKGPPFQTALF